jgi:hypothetical protein
MHPSSAIDFSRTAVAKPTQSQDVCAHFGYNEFELGQVFWILGMLFLLYTLLAFIAFRAISSSRHVVDMSMEASTRDVWGRRHFKKTGAS